MRIAVWVLALVGAALTVALALGVIGHDGPAKADAHPVGKVVNRMSNPGGVVLVVTTKQHGETRNVEVSRRAFASCSKGEIYPGCAKGGAK